MVTKSFDQRRKPAFRKATDLVGNVQYRVDWLHDHAPPFTGARGLAGKPPMTFFSGKLTALDGFKESRVFGVVSIESITGAAVRWSGRLRRSDGQPIQRDKYILTLGEGQRGIISITGVSDWPGAENWSDFAGVGSVSE